MTQPLAGRRVLVTRPSGQAAGLVRQLEQAGAAVLARPTLTLEPRSPDDWPPAPSVDWVVLTSPNAVSFGRPWLAEVDLSGVRVAAVGPGTAAAARAAGFIVTVAPTAGGGADDLLAEPAFTPSAGEQVWIVRGEDGRDRLQTVLRQAGVDVHEADVYRRAPAAATLDVPPEWRSSALDVTIVTSWAGLAALLGMVDPPALRWLHQSRLVTVSDRVADKARAAGFDDPVVAAGAADAELTAAVVRALQREGND